MSATESLSWVAFRTDLGWMALVGRAGRVSQLVFGHSSRDAAVAALDPAATAGAKERDWCPALVRRLQDYAAGAPEDLSDVEVDLDHLSGFSRKVIAQCRAIPYGCTQSYAQLARRSGSERGARAVGNAMATNRLPLLVPCHRVVRSNGNYGHFSAPEGPRMKARLLAMEQRGARSH